MRSSLEQFDMDFDLVPISSKGSWEKNVSFKPRFVLEKLKETNVPLLWLDADSVVLQKPDFSLFEGVDFSVRFMDIFEDSPQHKLNAATLFINQTEEAHRLVQQWMCRATELGPIPFVDQIALHETIRENITANVLPLPVSYCKIFDLDTFFIDDEHVVIEQRQASRRYK